MKTIASNASGLQAGAESDQVFLHGMDKAGRPLITVTAAAFVVADQRDVEECTLGVCSILDRAVEQACRRAAAPRVCRSHAGHRDAQGGPAADLISPHLMRRRLVQCNVGCAR